MAQNEIPQADVVRQLLDYDPATGILTWRERGDEWFAESGRQTPQAQANSWNARNAGRKAFTASDGKGYLQGQVAKYHTMAHRVVWVFCYGYWPNLVDHIDGNGTNNRLANLRSVNRSENARNSSTPSRNTSGHIGIRYRDRFMRWEAFIVDQGKSKYLGMYDNMDDAIAARKDAEKRLGYHQNHGRQLTADRVRRTANGMG